MEQRQETKPSVSLQFQFSCQDHYEHEQLACRAQIKAAKVVRVSETDKANYVQNACVHTEKRNVTAFMEMCNLKVN